MKPKPLHTRKVLFEKYSRKDDIIRMFNNLIFNSEICTTRQHPRTMFFVNNTSVIFTISFSRQKHFSINTLSLIVITNNLMNRKGFDTDMNQAGIVLATIKRFLLNYGFVPKIRVISMFDTIFDEASDCKKPVTNQMLKSLWFGAKQPKSKT